MKFLSILKFLLILGIFYYLFKNYDISFNKLLHINLNENIFIIILVLSLISLTYFIGAFRWWLILKSFNYKVSFQYILQVTYIGAFFNNVLFGAYGGDIVKGYYIYKFSNNSIKTVLTIIIDRIFGFIGLVVIGITSFVIFIDEEFFKYLINNFYLLIVFIIVLSILLFLSYFFFKKNFLKLFNKIKNYINSFLLYVKKNRILFLLYIALSIGIFFSVHLSVFFISDIIYSFKIGIEKIFLINFFTTIVNVLPISPGGLGVGELIFVKANNFFSENQNHIINIGNVIILFRLINFVACIPGAIIYVLHKKKL